MEEKRRKVLLADDVEIFLDIEKSFLQRDEIDLVVAHSGREAIETIRRERPDIAMIDLNMPEVDGIAVCRAVKSDPEIRATPVILIIQGEREEDRRRCEDAGCDAVIFKPINRHLFLSTVRGFLRIVERSAHRIPARFRVYYGVNSESLLAEYSVNLSTGGIFIETSTPLPEGTPLRVSFELPERAQQIVCRARVSWVNIPETPIKRNLPPGMGIQFLDISFQDRVEILAFVKQRLLAPAW